MITTPSSISSYLQSIGVASDNPAYLHFDECNRLLFSSNTLNKHGLTFVDKQNTTVDQIAFLEGLLPCKPNPLVIPRMQLAARQYSDVHMFSDSKGQWVLLLNSTFESLKAQKVQQIRLSAELRSGG